tara:strand:+ start:108 stop:293 length:186 start_codon:yes stop_codon:yes gene_type:complete
MNIKKLYENVDNIELTLEKFREHELTRVDTFDILTNLGYSKREAHSILDNLTGTTTNGLDR